LAAGNSRPQGVLRLAYTARSFIPRTAFGAAKEAVMIKVLHPC
jgi:hypothetical protein